MRYDDDSWGRASDHPATPFTHGRRGPGGHGPGGRRGRGGPDGWHGGDGWQGGPPPWLRGALGALGGAAFARKGAHGGGPWEGMGGRRRSRGDVRLAVIGLLATEPMHGYQLIREVATRSGGSWRISPGSVYPTLSALEDEGLVRSDDDGGRRSFRLTEAGRAELADRGEEFEALWGSPDEAGAKGWQELAGLLAQVGAAAVQVGSEGTEQQRERAATLLEDTRRGLYRILADDVASEEPSGEAQ